MRWKARIIRPSFATPTHSNESQSDRSSSDASYRIPTQATGRPCSRAARANRIGNRPLPASRPIGSARAARACRHRARDGADCSIALTSLAPLLRMTGPALLASAWAGDDTPERGELCGQLAKLAVHLGQPRDHLEEPALLANGNRRRAEHVLTVRNVAMDAGLRPDDHAVADLRVVLDARLARPSPRDRPSCSFRRCRPGRTEGCGGRSGCCDRS